MKGLLLTLLALAVNATVFAMWSNPVLLPPPINVNPLGDYYYSTISADGQVLCMTINTSEGFGNDDVYISERIGESDWTVPVNAGSLVNNDQRNLSPSITSDRQKLYYVSWIGSSYDIFVSERTGPDWDDWSAASALPEPINRGREFTAQIGADDSTLIFTSTGQPGPLFGADAMYKSHLQSDGFWEEPTLLAFHLNRPNGSYHPSMTADEQILVYGRFGGPDRHYDVFYAVANDTGFSEAIRLDSTINTESWDSGPSITADGSELYFESRYWDNPTHIQARLFVAQRIEPVILFSEQNALTYVINAYPNPFNPVTTLTLSLSGVQDVNVGLYDISGRYVKNIAQGGMTAGEHSIKVDAAGLPSGIYFARAQAGTQTITKKLVLLK